MNNITKSVFKNRKANRQKLLAYGFTENGGLNYTSSLLDGQFELRVKICADCEVNADLFDTETGDKFTLFLTEGATGAFVGEVRAAYEQALSEIAENCFDVEIYSEPNIKRAIAYVCEKYGAELEFLWKNDDSAIWRRADNSKWFGVAIKVRKSKLGLDGDGIQEVLVLRAKPEEIDRVADGKKYLRGYHMNKKRWLTVLPFAVGYEEIFMRIDASFALAKK